MRWFVAIGPLGKSATEPKTHCVEGRQWQEAIKIVRRSTGADDSMRNFSIEILDEGVRAVDPVARARYVVTRAPDDAELTLQGNTAASAAPTPSAQPKGQTATFGSTGTAAFHEAVTRSAAAIEPPSRPTMPSQPPVDLVKPKPSRPLYATPAPTPSPVPKHKIALRREEEPSASSPLTYREYAYCVATGTTEREAQAFMLARFEELKAQLSTRPKGKLVNLAIFDHDFDKRPKRAPLVTLVWKDWKSPEPELHYPARPGASLPAASLGEAPAAQPSAPPPQAAAKLDVATPPSAPVALRRDSGRMTPSGRPLPAEDMLTELFEAMHDLHFVRDAAEGAGFILNLALDKLRSRMGIVQLYDINRREFAVVRAIGPGHQQTVGGRTAERDPLVVEIMQRKGPFVVDATRDERVRAGRWRALGGAPKLILATGVLQGGRFLGTIEIGEPTSGSYHKADMDGLAYIAERFAEFAATKGILFEQGAPR